MSTNVRVRLSLCAALLVCAAQAAAQEAPRTQGRVAASRPAAARPAASRPATPPSAYRPALTRAIPFNATGLNGDDVEFPKAYQGKLVLLAFWATWCPHCRAELGYWREAYDKFHDDGLVMIGFPSDRNRGTSRDAVADYVQKNGLAWEQVYIAAPELADAYQATSVPTLYLIDADTGSIVARRQELRGEALAKTIAEQLAIKKGLPPPATSQPATTQPAASQPVK